MVIERGQVAKFYNISACIHGDISANSNLCILFAQLKTRQKGSRMEQANMVFEEKEKKIWIVGWLRCVCSTANMVEW